jgi:predicted transcriptional regulator
VAKSTTMTVRVAPKVSKKLTVLARDMKRSKSYLAGEAISAFVDQAEWQVARIKKALVEAEAGKPGVPHAEVVRWVASWGTDKELKRPKPKKS